MSATDQPPAATHRLVRMVVLLSWTTIAYNVVEGLVSVAFGWADESVALFGFGVDSFIEVGSAGLVLWRFRAETGRGAPLAISRERRATLGIGALFLVLGAGVVVSSALQLAARRLPETTVPGLVVAGVSLSFMLFLWRAKRRLAVRLDSATVERDAACSLVCLQLSAVLLAGSLAFAVAPALWWADSAAALALGVLVGREGIGTIRAARRADFAGGCGCPH